MTWLRAAMIAALCAGPALSAGHDRQLEQWIKDHVASRIGDIRGSIDMAAIPVGADNDNRPPAPKRAADSITTGSLRAD